ncbi:hypothetical protein [Streptomyces sp. NPDC029004]
MDVLKDVSDVNSSSTSFFTSLSLGVADIVTAESAARPSTPSFV